MGSYASKYAKAAACLATLTTLAHSPSVCLSVCCLGAAQLQLQLQLLLQQLLLWLLLCLLCSLSHRKLQTNTDAYTHRKTHESERSE